MEYCRAGGEDADGSPSAKLPSATKTSTNFSIDQILGLTTSSSKAAQPATAATQPAACSSKQNFSIQRPWTNFGGIICNHNNNY